MRVISPHISCLYQAMIPVSTHRFDTVVSTNDIALKMARAGEPEGTVVFARSQTAGRGRRGRAWFDEPGSSVLMSVILRPDIPLNRVSELSFTAALSVAELLECEFALKPTLKWPNDVLVRNRKIAGILVETTRTHIGNAAVVGIGLNINTTEFPCELEDIATSVAAETGSVQDVDSTANVLTKNLLDNYGVHLALGFEEILARWRKYMWGLDKQVRVETEGRILEGNIQGVDTSGALVLADSSGREYKVRAADTVRLVA